MAKVKEWLINYSAANLFNEETWLAFSENLTFVQGDSTKHDDLTRIKNTYFGDDHELIIYLAVPPLIFGKIATALDACGLAKPSTRIVVEKPLGIQKNPLWPLMLNWPEYLPRNNSFASITTWAKSQCRIC